MRVRSRSGAALLFLLALFGWRIGTAAGLAYSAFAALIFIGSIHLGFHYAVDGYAATLIALLVWRFAGRYGRAVGVAPAPAAA